MFRVIIWYSQMTFSYWSYWKKDLERWKRVSRKRKMLCGLWRREGEVPPEKRKAQAFRLLSIPLLLFEHDFQQTRKHKYTILCCYGKWRTTFSRCESLNKFCSACLRIKRFVKMFLQTSVCVGTCLSRGQLLPSSSDLFSWSSRRPFSSAFERRAQGPTAPCFATQSPTFPTQVTRNQINHIVKTILFLTN